MKIQYISNCNSLSMQIYFAELERNIASLSGVETWLPPINSYDDTKYGRLSRIFRSYIFHPLYYTAISKIKKFDITHIIDQTDSYLIKYINNENTVITCHDLLALKVSLGQIAVLNDTRLPDKASLRRAAKRIQYIRNARKIIAVSETTRKDLIELLDIDSAKIEVIYSGLNYCFKPVPPLIRRQLRKNIGVETNKVLLHVGSNAFYKNVAGILSALLINKKYNTDNRLLFLKVGADFTSDQKKYITEYGLEGQVKYYGRAKDYKELNDIYNLADIFLFPSLYEGFGWPPLEAMACGVPVLSSSRGSLGEVLGDAPFYVPPDDYDKIASGIVECLEDTRRRVKMVARGILIARGYDWVTTALKVHKIYESLGTNLC